MDVSLNDIAKSLSYIVEGKKVKTLPRSYLGMSQLGHNCARYLWFYFRWADYLEYKPRTLRIFQAGNDTETILVNALKQHFKVTNTQITLTHAGGYIQGHIDGEVEGIPELEDEILLLEGKSMQEKYFKKFTVNPLEVSNPGYYAQSIIYARKQGRKYILEAVLNKNTSEIEFEIFEGNPDRADYFLQRSEDIVFSKVPPKGISDDPSYYECGWCDFKETCHSFKPFVKTCRTCQQCSLPGEAQFYCNKDEVVLSVEQQKDACSEYNMLEV